MFSLPWLSHLPQRTYFLFVLFFCSPLYCHKDTAITRARVNVFIAETNIEAARPMFTYFQRRAVVDVASKDNSNLSSVRVFGAMNNVEDWRSRGEYYLQNAEGERQKGCLSLAAKCFDKSGQWI